VNAPTPARSLVVVVEDDPASRRSLGRVLRAGGFDTVMFPSVEEFLSATLESTPIAMLLDLQFAGLSGVDLQRHLKAAGSQLAIIVLTANVDARVREEVERLGCLAYLSKPCNGHTILALLRSLPADAASPR
jgi:FixJ family two-component response regulator